MVTDAKTEATEEAMISLKEQEILFSSLETLLFIRTHIDKLSEKELGDFINPIFRNPEIPNDTKDDFRYIWEHRKSIEDVQNYIKNKYDEYYH